jgi:hypothetical protein
MAQLDGELESGVVATAPENIPSSLAETSPKCLLRYRAFKRRSREASSIINDKSIISPPVFVLLRIKITAARN